MTLAQDIDQIGDELVAAFHEWRLASCLDYLLERLEAAAMRAAALEANCGVPPPAEHKRSGAGNVVDLKAWKECFGAEHR